MDDCSMTLTTNLKVNGPTEKKCQIVYNDIRWCSWTMTSGSKSIVDSSLSSHSIVNDRIKMALVQRKVKNVRKNKRKKKGKREWERRNTTRLISWMGKAKWKHTVTSVGHLIVLLYRRQEKKQLASVVFYCSTSSAVILLVPCKTLRKLYFSCQHQRNTTLPMICEEIALLC